MVPLTANALGNPKNLKFHDFLKANALGNPKKNLTFALMSKGKCLRKSLKLGFRDFLKEMP